MARNQQVLRQWRLWILLGKSPSPLSAHELAERLGPERVTERTVRRDLELLRELGIPVREIRDGRSQRYCARGDGPDLRLDGETLLALRLGLGLLRPYEGTPIADALDHVVRRLEAQVPPKLLAHFSPLTEALAVRVPGPSYARSEPVFQAVRRALQQRRRLAIEYEARDGARTSRRVHPQGLLQGPRGLYLLALDDTREGALRTFRLERIRAARVDAAPALRDPDIDADRYLAGSLGVHSPEHAPRRFRIRVHDPAAARDLEETPWHSSQTLSPQRDGTWILELTLESTRELVPQVLALGAAAEVLEPASLRAEIAAHVRGAAARYGREASSKGDLGGRSRPGDLDRSRRGELDDRDRPVRGAG